MDLTQLARKETKRVVGLMSGTSVDGIDAALVEIKGRGIDTQVKLVAFANYPIDPEIRSEIFALFRPESSNVETICHMNFVIGEVFAEAVNRIIRQAGLRNRDVDLIGSHGQTLYHIPSAQTTGPITTASTLQMGEPAVIAERTGVTTVANFRTRDMAVGGQGAPLVPYVDYVLFRHPTVTRAIQNIGGIGNVTYLPADASLDQVLAFDTGPGNMIIDALVKFMTGGREHFDRDGKLAAAGRVSESLLAELMQHPYISLKPPKTTGRELFGEQFTKELIVKAQRIGVSGPDLVATATAFTAESIAYHYRRYLSLKGAVQEVVIGGGGCYNPTLLGMLRERLAPAKVLTHEDLGISSDAKEAIAFAILANETICGLPSNVPTATGARRPVVLGSITPA
ncbi:MAG: anhydro-N-acetylmuramic acid kinase [Bacillota bacterium]